MRRSIRRWPAICLTAAVATMLAACHGTGTGSNVIPQVSQQSATALTPDVLKPISIYPGEVVGQDDMFGPHDGDTITGGRGGKSVGKIPCDKTEYLNNYHVHAYLGVIYKGKQIAIPDAIGMRKPGAEQNGYISTAGCYYFIHTHDASGMIHIEDPTNLPPSATPYKLQNVLAVWGIKYTTKSFGALKGGVTVFVGNVPALGQTTVSSYTRWTKTAQLGAIPMKSHEAIFIEIGKYVPATKLPSVTFYTEY